MTKNKKFFKSTKYLWIGGALGVLQQFLGNLRTVDPIFDKYDLSEIMGGLTFWGAFILLLLMRRAPAAKEHFRDILLLFIGLDFFYYLYVFFLDIYERHQYLKTDPDNNRDLSYFLQNALSEVPDFLMWTAIGLAAGILGYIAIRSRDKDRKKLYILFLAPFFAVFVLMIAEDAAVLFNYIKWENTPAAEREPGISYSFYTVGPVTDMLSAMISIYMYAKRKPWNYPPQPKKDNSRQ
jgi:hypothetical protein